MKRIRTGVAIVAMLGVVAGAMAARMDWAWPEAARGGNRTAAMGATSASAAAATGTRANGSAPLVPGGQFTIVGDVVDLASANEPMTVIARVGDNVFPAAVQGNTYTVRVSGGPSTTMVKIEVESTRVHYESVLGTFGRLKARAGADARLVQSESAWVRVSSYTTALSVMTEHQLSGRAANSDAELERAMRATTADDLEAAAYLMAKNADGTLFLHHPNGYEAVRNRQDFSGGMSEYEFWERTFGFLSNRAPSAPVTSLDELPSRLVMVAGLSAQSLPMDGSRRVFLLQKGTGSQVSFYESWPLANTQYTASITADGTIVLIPTVPPVHRAFSIEHNATVERRRTRFELRRLYQGDAYGHWAVRMFWTEQVIAQPSQPVTTGSWEYVLAATDVERWSQPEGWGSLADQTRAMPWLCIDWESNLERCESARHVFAGNGTGTTLGHGPKLDSVLVPLAADSPGFGFNWSVDASARTLRTSQTTVSTTFWRVEGNDHGAGTLLYLAQDQASGQARVGVDFMIPQPDRTQWLASADGQWRRADYFPASPGYYYRFHDGQFEVDRGSGLAAYLNRPGYMPGVPTPVSYLSYMHQGAVIDHRANVAGAPTTCDINGPNRCVTLIHYFRPLMRVGNRYYGLQEEYEHVAAGNGFVGVDRKKIRATFQDCMGGACTGPTGLTDRAAASATTAASRGWLIERAPVSQRLPYPASRRVPLR